MENKFLSRIVKYSTHLYGGWVLFIALLTLLPASVVNIIDWNFMSIDKLAHLFMFTIMAILGSIHFCYGRWPGRLTYPAFTSLVTAWLYGTLLEYTQALVPSRTFDYADLTANFAGTLLGIILYKWLIAPRWQ